MMTEKGDVWVSSGLQVIQKYVRRSLTHTQDPPEQVINNCNQEIDEVLRYASG